MNKIITVVMALVLMASVFSGCDIQPEQIKVIAQNAGLFSAVGWIAVDNPDADAIAAVKSVLKTIEEKAADVQAGSTYTEVVYPEVIKIVDKDVESQYRPICKAGALSLLGGIDMLFATHPEWKKDQDLAISVVNAFVLGSKNGLSLSDKHPAMIQARSTAAHRSKALKSKKKWFGK